jgi:hypothetical protein
LVAKIAIVGSRTVLFYRYIVVFVPSAALKLLLIVAFCCVLPFRLQIHSVFVGRAGKTGVRGAA